MIDAINSFLRKVPVWPVYGLFVALTAWLFWLGVSNQLGAEPIKTLIHELGEMALKFLILGLMITPLRRWAGLNLIKFRRAVGLVAFYFMLVHLLVWVFLDQQSWQLIWKEIVKRPYITIGMLAFTLCVPIAVTSNNWSCRHLYAKTWNRIHRLTYPVVALGGLHFLMLTKGWQPEPMIYMALIVVLLGLRLIPKRRAAPRETPGGSTSRA